MAAPFDPRHSTRRFVIGAPDGVSSVILPPLLETLHGAAPGIDVGIRQLLPVQGFSVPHLAWKDALKELEDRAMDVAIIPFDDIPVRFHKAKLYEEEFVISHTGDVSGFVDVELSKRSLARRVALTVPNFMFALSLLAETGLVSALPRRFVEVHGARFGVVAVKAPLPLPRFSVNVVVPKVAMMDAGLAWLVQSLTGNEGSAVPNRSVSKTARLR
jgi:DNA-binding transcriptional LysR family regulator